MSGKLIADNGVLLDWPASWDKPVILSNDEAWLRFMHRLWLARWPVIWSVLTSRFIQLGIEDVRKFAVRLSDSTTAMQAAAWHAKSLPEDELASAFNAGWDMLSQPVTVVDTPPGILLEDHIHVDVLDDGSWVHASIEDCGKAAALQLILDRIEALGPCFTEERRDA